MNELNDDYNWGTWYKARYGYDVAHLSGHWYEREKGLYIVFSCRDLRKLAHHAQVKLIDETSNGYLFSITLNGINRCIDRGYEIEIGEPLPELEE